MEIDLVVGEGGVLHVPLPPGTPVRVLPRKFADYTREEWLAFVHEFSGSIPDLQVPERTPPRTIDRLDED